MAQAWSSALQRTSGHPSPAASALTPTHSGRAQGTVPSGAGCEAGPQSWNLVSFLERGKGYNMAGSRSQRFKSTFLASRPHPATSQGGPIPSRSPTVQRLQDLCPVRDRSLMVGHLLPMGTGMAGDGDSSPETQHMGVLDGIESNKPSLRPAGLLKRHQHRAGGQPVRQTELDDQVDEK